VVRRDPSAPCSVGSSTCANIAILIYARNLSRQDEFAARYALGASRSRIVGQLLIEGLVLAGAAAGMGLVLTYQFVERVQRLVDQQPELRLNVPNATQFRIYHPLASAMAPGEIDSVRLTLRVGSAIPPGLAGQLIGIARALDTNLQVKQFRTLDDVDQEDLWVFTTLGLGFATIALVVVLFSAAGIHTLVAFAVAQRHREIGIRSALGAPPSRLVADVFRRHLSPVLAGVIVGALMAWRIDVSFANDNISVTVLSASAAFMIAIGLIAVAGPARRAIRINPSEALREG